MDHAHQDGRTAIDLLKTARGQVEASLRMMGEDRNCMEVSRQVHASIALLKKANLVMLKRQMNTCVKEAIKENNSAEKVEEIATIIDKYLESEVDECIRPGRADHSAPESPYTH